MESQNMPKGRVAKRTTKAARAVPLQPTSAKIYSTPSRSGARPATVKITRPKSR